MLWNREELLAWRDQLSLRGEKLVFTNGCFDILHIGHLRQLEQAAARGDRLIVGLNSDDSVRRLKGPPRPFVCLDDRAELLAALRVVDRVAAFDEDTPLELISLVKPDILVKGGDYRPEDVVGKDVVEALGGSVVIIPLVPGRSTSSLIKRIRRSP